MERSSLAILYWKVRMRVLVVRSRLLHFFKIPGLVCEGIYHSGCTYTPIRVDTRGFYTTISVNGFDVSFNRFSGKFAGVGFSPNNWARVRKLILASELPESAHRFLFQP